MRKLNAFDMMEHFSFPVDLASEAQWLTSQVSRENPPFDEMERRGMSIACVRYALRGTPYLMSLPSACEFAGLSYGAAKRIETSVVKWMEDDADEDLV